jgi:hypothetical protein
VQPLIAEGKKAVPFLNKVSHSPDFSKSQLALVCLKLIQGRQLEIGERLKDHKSGIILVSYSVSY